MKTQKLVPSISAHSASTPAPAPPLTAAHSKLNSQRCFSCRQASNPVPLLIFRDTKMGPPLYRPQFQLLEDPTLASAVETSFQLWSSIWSRSKKTYLPSCLLLVSQGIISLETVLNSKPACPPEGRLTHREWGWPPASVPCYLACLLLESFIWGWTSEDACTKESSTVQEVGFFC